MQRVPGGRELSAKWKFLTVGEKAQAVLIHDMRGMIDSRKEGDRVSRSCTAEARAVWGRFTAQLAAPRLQ